MKITKRQLRRIILESLQLETTSHERITGLPSEFVEDNWLPWLAERGLGAEDLDDLARFTGAPDRSWLPAEPPADGMDGPADLEFWARNKKAGIKEVNMKITKRQLRRIIKEEKARLLKEFGDQPIPRAPGVEVYRISMVVAVEEGSVDAIQGSIEDGMEFNEEDGEGILEYDIRPETSEYFNKPPRRGNY